MTLNEVSRAVNGIIQGDGEKEVAAVSTDSRTLKQGNLFVALRGERYDAHHYLESAIKSGAGALIVERYDLPDEVPVIVVRDTLKAMQALASYNRRQFAVPVVAITGSSGKTTTKDMVASVLAQKFNVLKTKGNFNNEVGLPLTLLEMDETHQAVVVELAMRGPGEIDRLAGISSPSGAVITNVGEAHLERLGSIENIARAKAELLDHIGKDGFAALHRESPFLAREASRCGGEVITFGDKEADVYAVNIQRKKNGNEFTVIYGSEQAQMFTPVTGLHNVQNALASVIVGKQLGLHWNEIAEGLGRAAFSAMRMETEEVGGVTIINDAYNANPSSTKAALQALRETAGEKKAVAVLGNMLELGSGTKDGHTAVGKVAASYGVEYLFTVGDLAEYIAKGAEEAGMNRDNICTYTDNRGVAYALGKVLAPGNVVLVKGSRGMHMEEIVEELINDLRSGNGGTTSGGFNN